MMSHYTLIVNYVVITRFKKLNTQIDVIIADLYFITKTAYLIVFFPAHHKARACHRQHVPCEPVSAIIMHL